MIKCNNGIIRISKMYNPQEDCNFTFITASLNDGIIYKEYTIKVGAIKQRYKFSGTRKSKLKPFTAYEIQDKIIKSLIKTLGGEIK